MLDAAEGKGDEDASWAMCYLGTDPQAGLTQAQTKRRALRRRETYSALLMVLTDEDLKKMIRAEANRNGRTGPVVIVESRQSLGRVSAEGLTRVT